MDSKYRKDMERKEDAYLFRSELKLTKNNLDDMLRQARERQKAEFTDFFALDVSSEMETLH